MDINRLKEFITLATLLNYSKAANQLYLTQPALSRHIHDLEVSIGSPLFIRDTHNVQLTPVGEIFLVEATDLVNKYNSAMSKIKDVSSVNTGELKLGFLATASEYIMADFLLNFTAKFPEINMNMHSDNIDNLTRELNDGEIDLAVLTNIDKNFYSGLESEQITTDRLFCIVNPKHKFASKETIKMIELSGEKFINFSSVSNAIACDFHKQLFRKAGAEMKIVAEISNLESAMLYLNANMGCFIVPRYLLHLFKNYVAIPFEDDFCFVSLNLVWKKKNSNPSIECFTKELHSFMVKQNKKINI